MSVRLTQKEQQLLRDQSSHERVCIEKYSSYAQQVQDPQLKQMFNDYASQEQEHYNTLDQLLNGQQMSTAQGQARGQAQGMTQRQSQQQGQQSRRQPGPSGMADQDDAMLLSDMLMTEKFISGAYDTAVFESANPEVRQTLQHIQQEEQHHGEGIYDYMSQNGMYNAQ
ncbi:MAG: spore coat protein [Clostridia bacterium]|nr:spore coat protein [Clostridia bacterium]